MTIEAKGRSGLGQVEVEFLFALLAGLMGDVAGLAAHVESGMPAALLRNVNPDFMATQAEILLRVSGGRLQKLVFVLRCVRIMTLYAITHRGAVNCALDVRGILVRVAGQAQTRRSSRDQLDPRDVFVDANLMATGAAHRDRRVDGLALAFFRMAFQALR